MGLIDRLFDRIRRYRELRRAEKTIREWEAEYNSVRNLPFIRITGYPIPHEVCDAMADSVLLRRY